jgi:hypothetical protein
MAETRGGLLRELNKKCSCVDETVESVISTRLYQHQEMMHVRHYRTIFAEHLSAALAAVMSGLAVAKPAGRDVLEKTIVSFTLYFKEYRRMVKCRLCMRAKNYSRNCSIRVRVLEQANFEQFNLDFK